MTDETGHPTDSELNLLESQNTYVVPPVMEEGDERIVPPLVSSVVPSGMQEQLDRIEQHVMELHHIVQTLLTGIGEAQNAGGMAGMMARQLPDMTTFLTAQKD